MKKIARFIMSALCFSLTGASFAHAQGAAISSGSDTRASIEECFGSYSGAGSVDCLEHLYHNTNLQIRRMENQIVAQSRKRWLDGAITGTHDELAVSSMRDAARRFKKFSERQCDFEIGFSGAAASGSGQVWYKCLLKFNEERKAYLRDVLKNNAADGAEPAKPNEPPRKPNP